MLRIFSLLSFVVFWILRYTMLSKGYLLLFMLSVCEMTGLRLSFLCSFIYFVGLVTRRGYSYVAYWILIPDLIATYHKKPCSKVISQILFFVVLTKLNSGLVCAYRAPICSKSPFSPVTGQNFPQPQQAIQIGFSDPTLTFPPLRFLA